MIARLYNWLFRSCKHEWEYHNQYLRGYDEGTYAWFKGQKCKKCQHVAEISCNIVTKSE